MMVKNAGFAKYMQDKVLKCRTILQIRDSWQVCLIYAIATLLCSKDSEDRIVTEMQ